jgi:hypothetical protein
MPKTSTEVKVGDVVTYRKPSYTRTDGQGFQPLGVSGCVVTDLWVTDFGEEAATIRAFGEEIHVPRHYLTIEE